MISIRNTTILACLLCAGTAHAQEVNVVTWGGAIEASQVEAYNKPFTKAMGIRVTTLAADDPSTPLKAQVEAGNVTGDVFDIALADAVRLCDEGMLLEIDPAALPPGADGTPADRDFIDGALQDCAVGNIVAGTVIAYDKTKFPDTPPTTVADFFDTKTYPGKRALAKSVRRTLYLALMADGVPASEVYDQLATDEGVDRAFAKLDTIKSEVIWWEAGAQPPQLLADGEVAMTTAYNGRIFDAMINEGIPFGLFGKTAFMAERVLGNIVSSGIKVLVLAVIIGIGSTLFSQFTMGFGGAAPTVDDAMAIVLAALSLLGLGIFGPGIATGLVSGGPQLGAGAVAGTGLAVGGAALTAGGATVLGAKGIAATTRGGAATAGAASAAYTLHSAGQSGISGALSGAAGVGKGAGIAALSPLRKAAASISRSHGAGVKTAFTGTGGSTTQGTLGCVGASAPTSSSSSPGSPPAWAQRLRGQSLGRGATVAAHVVRSGDSHGPGASVSLSENDKP